MTENISEGGIIIDNEFDKKESPKLVTLEQLDGALNLPVAVFYNPDTRQRGIVVNSQNMGELWDIFHELEDVIKSIKFALIKRQQATSVQPVSADVLSKLRG